MSKFKPKFTNVSESLPSYEEGSMIFDKNDRKLYFDFDNGHLEVKNGDTLPTTTTAGKVLTSTTTAGTVQWEDAAGGIKKIATVEEAEAYPTEETLKDYIYYTGAEYDLSHTISKAEDSGLIVNNIDKNIFANKIGVKNYNNYDFIYKDAGSAQPAWFINYINKIDLFNYTDFGLDSPFYSMFGAYLNYTLGLTRGNTYEFKFLVDGTICSTTAKAEAQYLGDWDCTTGLPTKYPDIPEGAESPYTYTFNSSDYYIINNVPILGTKYMPDGASITATKSGETWTWSVGKKEYTGEETLVEGGQFKYASWNYKWDYTGYSSLDIDCEFLLGDLIVMISDTPDPENSYSMISVMSTSGVNSIQLVSIKNKDASNSELLLVESEVDLDDYGITIEIEEGKSLKLNDTIKVNYFLNSLGKESEGFSVNNLYQVNKNITASGTPIILNQEFDDETEEKESRIYFNSTKTINKNILLQSTLPSCTSTFDVAYGGAIFSLFTATKSLGTKGLAIDESSAADKLIYPWNSFLSSPLKIADVTYIVNGSESKLIIEPNSLYTPGSIPKEISESEFDYYGITLNTTEAKSGDKFELLCKQNLTVKAYNATQLHPWEVKEINIDFTKFIPVFEKIRCDELNAAYKRDKNEANEYGPINTFYNSDYLEREEQPMMFYMTIGNDYYTGGVSLALNWRTAIFDIEGESEIPESYIESSIYTGGKEFLNAAGITWDETKVFTSATFAVKPELEISHGNYIHSAILASAELMPGIANSNIDYLFENDIDALDVSKADEILFTAPEKVIAISISDLVPREYSLEYELMFGISSGWKTNNPYIAFNRPSELPITAETKNKVVQLNVIDSMLSSTAFEKEPIYTLNRSLYTPAQLANVFEFNTNNKVSLKYESLITPMSKVIDNKTIALDDTTFKLGIANVPDDSDINDSRFKILTGCHDENDGKVDWKVAPAVAERDNTAQSQPAYNYTYLDRICPNDQAASGELATELTTLRLNDKLYSLSSSSGGGATNLENGTGTNAVQMKSDGGITIFDFTNKNPNATALDPTLTGYIDYGATGNFSSVLGGKNAAFGKRSHAEGTTTIAKGNYSHCEGDNSVTLGADSHAEGYATVTNGTAAHAEGINTQALAYGAHAEGMDTIASGNYSHAEGCYSKATAEQAHAGGTGTIADSVSETAIGLWNKPTNELSGTPLFVVGNGTEDNRSDALEVFTDGSVKFNKLFDGVNQVPVSQIIEQCPEAPDEDGVYQLVCEVVEGNKTYYWTII